MCIVCNTRTLSWYETSSHALATDQYYILFIKLYWIGVYIPCCRVSLLQSLVHNFLVMLNPKMLHVLLHIKKWRQIKLFFLLCKRTVRQEVDSESCLTYWVNFSSFCNLSLTLILHHFLPLTARFALLNALQRITGLRKLCKDWFEVETSIIYQLIFLVCTQLGGLQLSQRNSENYSSFQCRSSGKISLFCVGNIRKLYPVKAFILTVLWCNASNVWNF